jgi:hypothetical protein
MKRSILFMILIALFFTGKVLATDTAPIIIQKVPPEPTPGPTPLTQPFNFIPVTTTINDSDLAIYFETSFGVATITITDDMNQSVYQSTTDTDSTTGIDIPVSLYSNGNYKLSINYGSTTLTGEFLIE